MDYIEFKIVDESIVCKYVYNKKTKLLNSKESIKLFRYLNNSNYSYKEGIINGERAIRYYGVKYRLVNSIINNRKGTRIKVSRVNRYAGKVATISSLLAIAITLNSMGIFDKLGSINNDNADMITNASEEVTIPVFKPINIPSNMENEIDEEIVTEITQEDIIISDYTFNVDYQDRSNNEKACITRELYSSVIDKYSKMYGLPTNLMVAMATQECGIHKTEVSKGGGLGLFQVQVENGWNWLGKELTAYNYEMGKNETIIVCKNEKGSIDKYMLSDLEYNVKVACMIMAHDLKVCNNDLLTAIQMYNSGSKVLELKKQYRNNWIENRQTLPGDPSYLEHVLSYINSDDNLLEYKTINGEVRIMAIDNNYNQIASKTMK